MQRRPHRSFRLTRRRDYSRSLELPGYIAFSSEVIRLLWVHKRLFGVLVLAYAVLTGLLVGIASQNSFNEVRSLIDDTSESLLTGVWGEIGKAGILLFTGVSGSLLPELTEAQQIYSGLLVLLTWLTTVWLLRSIFAGNTPRLRDGIYSAGSPIVATALVALYMIIQSIPIAIAVIILSTLGSLSGLLSMVFSIVAVLLIILSLYLLTGSFMALIIVTLPGMYPWRAIRAAGDLVIGRRIRILLRMAWLVFSVMLLWLVTIVPVTLVDNWLIGIAPVTRSWPVVPIALLLVASFVTVWASAYVYMLYRKVVDDDAAPA